MFVSHFLKLVLNSTLKNLCSLKKYCYIHQNRTLLDQEVAEIEDISSPRPPPQKKQKTKPYLGLYVMATSAFNELMQNFV